MPDLTAIPWWLHALVATLGLVLGVLLILLSVRRQQAGRSGGGAMVGAVLSLLLLAALPVVLLAVGQSGEPSRTAAVPAPADPAATADPLNGVWRVSFSDGTLAYLGEFRPSGGEGPMVVRSAYQGSFLYARQTCRIERGDEIWITCRDPRNLTNAVGYQADRFVVRQDAGGRMRGDVLLPTGERAPVTFEPGRESSIPELAWTQPAQS